ncbi:MAG: hypothetical protein ABSB29_01080 [Nitrososphaerales archaeon]
MEVAEVPVNADELFDIVTKVVFDCGYSQTATDRSRRRLRVNTGVSGFSWGEIVEVYVDPRNEGKSIVHVMARRRLPGNVGSRPSKIARDLLGKIVAECNSPELPRT